MCDAVQGASIEFATFDILSDEDVRSGLKVYSSWPTFPQLCVTHTSRTHVTHMSRTCHVTSGV